MTNPTSNFGWVMPTATDLVTDLPADFAVFGQAVDTSMAGLKGGTTGQILSKTSNTDMAFTWTAANPGDITAVTAGTGISGGGTSGDVTVTNSMATALTTKGDLTPATGSAAFARLGVGANDTVLVADSTAATGMKWATPASGSMTLLSTTTLSGASTTISSISQSYRNLYCVWYGVNVSTAYQFRFAPNASTTITNTAWVSTAASNDFSTYGFLANTGQAWKNASTVNAGTLTIFNYSNTTYYKNFSATATGLDGAGTPVQRGFSGGGGIQTTSAISSLVISPDSGTMSAGTFLIYGVN